MTRNKKCALLFHIFLSHHHNFVVPIGTHEQNKTLVHLETIGRLIYRRQIQSMLRPHVFLRRVYK